MFWDFTSRRLVNGCKRFERGEGGHNVFTSVAVSLPSNFCPEDGVSRCFRGDGANLHVYAVPRLTRLWSKLTFMFVDSTFGFKPLRKMKTARTADVTIAVLRAS